DLPTLSRLGEAMGFTVRRMEPVVLEGGQGSSSQVRALLGEGRVADAARQLGRFYSVEGPVVHGDGRGSKIGFPTANLDLWEHKLLPANGVYACWAIVEGKRHPAVTNVGVRPTFGNHAPLRVETHLPGAASELYSKTMRLEFVEQLRSELRFASVQELIDQIHADIRKALEVLARDPQT
ncbi:MAG: hypothetical protein HY835_02500, partial [Anaerolineae bacterium]|nr:hypothetical protein [Anaerolineae bacterium]